MDPVAGLQALFREVASKAPRSSVPVLVSGTVASTAPLTVVLDSDPDAKPREADGTWVGPLSVGQSVRCELLGSDLLLVSAPGSLVIEGGAVSGGGWVRLPDATQICWVAMSRTDVALNAPYGSLYIGSWTWVFPRPFEGGPAVSCSRFHWGTSASWGTVQATSPTQATLRGLDAFSRAAGTSVSIEAVAIGRWK